MFSSAGFLQLIFCFWCHTKTFSLVFSDAGRLAGFWGAFCFSIRAHSSSTTSFIRSTGCTMVSPLFSSWIIRALPVWRLYRVSRYGMYELKIPIKLALVLCNVPSIEMYSGRLIIGPPEFPGKVCASTKNTGFPFFNKKIGFLFQDEKPDALNFI